MKKLITLVAVATLATDLLVPASSQAAEERYLVLAQGNGFSPGFDNAVENAGGAVYRKLSPLGVAIVRSADPAFVQKASAIPEVQALVPDMALPFEEDIHLAAVGTGKTASPWKNKLPDLTPFQWWLDAVHAKEACALGFTGKGVRVMLMDSGVMTAHPDLAQNLDVPLCRSFVEGEGVEFFPGGLLGTFSHATYVGGIIAAANNGFGTTGVAPDAELVVAKVANNNEIILPSDALAAFFYAVEVHANVLNMSWSVVMPKSFSRYPSEPPWDTTGIMTAFNRAANYAHNNGVTMVGSAGNSALDFDHLSNYYRIPRDLPHVIAVSATAPIGWALDPTTNLDVPASYTDYGQSMVDLAAPGGDGLPDLLPFPVTLKGITAPAWVFDMVISTSTEYGPAGPYEPTWNWASGTSAAAPCVAGVAALVIQANGGSLSPDQVRTILEQSADDLGKPGNDDFYGLGRVNALRAVLQK